jgi:deoxyribose-phosphate aldolase
MPNKTSLQKLIDYTLLDPSATNQEIIDLCKNAQKLEVASVCITPDKVRIAKQELENSKVLVCTVVSFPSGENSIEEKTHETTEAILNGADEIDVVINYKKLNDETYLVRELNTLRELCHAHTNKLGQPITLKVIVESGLHTLEETAFFTNICIQTKIDYIKTSTGKVAIGAELDKVKVMHKEIQRASSPLKIKASGGLRDIKQIETFLPYVHRLGIGHQTVDSFV